MGLLDEFDVDMDEIKANSFDVEDGHYEFEISEARIQRGTKKKPDDTFFVIDYNFGENGSKNEWFTVAEDGEVTARAKQSLSFLKTRLLDLGFKGVSLNDLDPEDLEGIRGTLQLFTKKTPKGEFQNIRNVKVILDDEPDEDDEPEEKPKAKAAAKKPVAKKATKAPAGDAEDDEDENPFE